MNIGIDVGIQMSTSEVNLSRYTGRGDGTGIREHGSNDGLTYHSDKGGW